MRRYTVKTQHTLPEYNGEFTFNVYDNHEGSYFANSNDFGCGKNAETPEGAIMSLAKDNGATVVWFQEETMPEEIKENIIGPGQRLPNGWTVVAAPTQVIYRRISYV